MTLTQLLTLFLHRASRSLESFFIQIRIDGSVAQVLELNRCIDKMRKELPNHPQQRLIIDGFKAEIQREQTKQTALYKRLINLR